jgi:caffeoyl-CoA O-methyltransferase
MSAQQYLLRDAWYDYLLSMSLREPDVLRRLREETASHPRAQMQIPPEHGQFMRLLVELTGARKALEVGVFTGYSSLSVALALPPGGRLVACDVSAEFTAIARHYWRQAGVEDRIELVLQPAADTLGQLVANGESGTFDFAFVDADKANYDLYYEKSLELLRPGGLLLIDNVFQMGRALEVTEDPDVVALRQLNAKILADERVSLSVLPIADGLTLARKRSAAESLT